MRRVAGLLALVVLGLVAPAATALDPEPRFFRFDDQAVGTPFESLYPGSGVTFAGDGSSCSGSVSERSHTSHYLRPDCGYVTISFDPPQRRVSLKIATDCCQNDEVHEIVAYDSGFDTVIARATVPPPEAGFPFHARTLRDPGGETTISHVQVSSGYDVVGIDDLMITRSPQPDTEVSSGPENPTRARTATFEVIANVPTTRFRCRLDAGAREQCATPVDFSGLGEGTHTFEVAAIDEYGQTDPTPATYEWRIDLTAPGVEITSGPPASTEARDATFTFRSRAADVASSQCSLDGAPFAACKSPAVYTVEPGAHEFRVRAVDRVGNVGAHRSREWTVTAPPEPSPSPSPPPPPLPPPPPPPPPPPDRDGDGVLDAVDNCGDAPNADQADEDGDAIGNACEILPSGDLPPVAGTSAVVRAVAGDVFVKLPAGSTAGFLSRLRGDPKLLFLEDGFVPLKGVASVPVGSTVDTQKGQVSMSSAFNSRPAADSRRKLQTAVFAAGIFRLRQKARRPSGKAASKKIATDLVLVTPTGADRICATAAGRSGPGKGLVRTLSGSGKGLFRTIGGASTTTARNATWITSDRCNGTRTEVGRGKVKVRDTRRRKTVTVRPGQGYLARAKLFRNAATRNDGAIKGRPSAG